MANCVTCGRAFEPRVSTQVYCCVKCRHNKPGKARGGPVMVERECEWCGKSFMARKRCATATRGGTARRCPECHYKRTTDAELAERAAITATTRLLAAMVRRAKLAEAELSFRRNCVACGKRFLPAPTLGCRAYCCSDECRKTLVLGHRRRAGRIQKSKRRALIRNLPHENIDPLDVFARDNWTCQICGDRTPRRLRGTYDDKAPELDHIIALAAGGTHTWDNVQCLCRACNGTKGAGAMNDQLRLELSA